MLTIRHIEFVIVNNFLQQAETKKKSAAYEVDTTKRQTKKPSFECYIVENRHLSPLSVIFPLNSPYTICTFVVGKQQKLPAGNRIGDSVNQKCRLTISTSLLTFLYTVTYGILSPYPLFDCARAKVQTRIIKRSNSLNSRVGQNNRVN